MMKKTLCCFLALLVCIAAMALSACTPNADDTTTAADAGENTPDTPGGNDNGGQGTTSGTDDNNNNDDNVGSQDSVTLGDGELPPIPIPKP